jgi:hypothetical protein
MRLYPNRFPNREVPEPLTLLLFSIVTRNVIQCGIK